MVAMTNRLPPSAAIVIPQRLHCFLFGREDPAVNRSHGGEEGGGVEDDDNNEYHEGGGKEAAAQPSRPCPLLL